MHDSNRHHSRVHDSPRIDPPRTDRATVVVRRQNDYAPASLAQTLARIVDQCGGWSAWIKPGDRILVKPNCIAAVPVDRPAQTHPAIITEVCRQLLDFGAKPFVADSPAWGSLRGALGRLQVIEQLDHLNVPIVECKRPKHAHNPHGHVFQHLTVDAAALEADAIVNLPKFKAHRQLLMTVVIKNMFGCVGGRRKAWWHVKAGGYENYFGRMLVETFTLLRPVINIVDAVVAMQGNGPIKGNAYPMGLLMGSTDGPALERITAAIVGVKPAQLRTLQAARELEVGHPYLDRITLDGPPLEELQVRDFVLPSLLPIGFSLPRLVKGTFRNAWILRQQAREETRPPATVGQ